MRRTLVVALVVGLLGGALVGERPGDRHGQRRVLVDERGQERAPDGERRDEGGADGGSGAVDSKRVRSPATRGIGVPSGLIKPPAPMSVRAPAVIGPRDGRLLGCDTGGPRARVRAR